MRRVALFCLSGCSEMEPVLAFSNMGLGDAFGDSRGVRESFGPLLKGMRLSVFRLSRNRLEFWAYGYACGAYIP